MKTGLRERRCTCLWGNATVTAEGRIRLEVTVYDPECPYPIHRLA